MKLNLSCLDLTSILDTVQYACCFMQTSSYFFLGCYLQQCLWTLKSQVKSLYQGVGGGDGSDSLQASSQKSSEGASHQRSTHLILINRKVRLNHFATVQ